MEASLDLEDGPGVEADSSGPQGWLRFPIRTGIGDGTAELHLQGRVARLPLGARPGEWSAVIDLLPEGDQLALDSARNTTNQLLSEARLAWQRGDFRLMDGDALVGEVHLDQAARASVGVYDSSWLADPPAAADWIDAGPDLVLRFAVEPSIGGEGAEIRINIPTMEVSVPTGSRPAAGDRHLRLVAGAVLPAEREEVVQAARAAADEMEEDWLAELGPALAREGARIGCPPFSALPADWPLLLAGYEVHLEPRGPECEATIEALVPQHRRRGRGRWSATATPSGP